MSLFSKNPRPPAVIISTQKDLDESFFQAMVNNDFTKAVQLHEQGADVNYQDKNKNTALHFCAANGNQKATKFLTETLGARLDIENWGSRLPEDSALMNNHASIANYLREMRKEQKSQQQEKEKPTGWVKTADDEIAHITFKESIGYRMTEVFNFSARTYVHIAQNLETKSESKTLTTFDDLANKPFLLNALQELQNLGGTSEESAIAGKQHLAKDGFGAGR